MHAVGEMNVTQSLSVSMYLYLSLRCHMITPEKLHTNEVGEMGEKKGQGHTGQDGTGQLS